MRISVISQVTIDFTDRLASVTIDNRAVTAANDTSLYFTILAVFLGFHPGGPG